MSAAYIVRHEQLDLAAFVAACKSKSEARRLSKLNAEAWRRAEAEGLSVEQADRLAVAAGCHATELWADFLALSAAEVSKPCDHCGEAFFPWRNPQRFCSKRCSQRWWSWQTRKKRLQADPEYRERMYARRRAYYQACGEYERARQRAYDRARRAA